MKDHPPLTRCFYFSCFFFGGGVALASFFFLFVVIVNHTVMDGVGTTIPLGILSWNLFYVVYPFWGYCGIRTLRPRVY